MQAIPDCQSDRGMTNPPSGLRRSKWLALGVFYDAESLANVLRELTAAGFNKDKFCIARLPAATPWAGGAPGASGEGLDAFGHLLSHCEEVRGASSDVTYLVTAGGLLNELCPSQQPDDVKRTLCPAWMTAGQCEQLTAHMQRGAAALIVKSENPAEQDACSRAMLRHSRHIVRTYDFFH